MDQRKLWRPIWAVHRWRIALWASIALAAAIAVANRPFLLRAWDASTSSMSTTTLAVLGGLLYPLAVLLVVFKKDGGWPAMMNHWGSRLKYSAYIAVVWWGLLFSYHLFITVPQRIFRD